MTAQHALAEADPAELAGRGRGGRGVTPLAEHVSECSQCRAVAERILAAQQELADALAAAHPRLDVNEAIQLARAEARRAPRWRVVRRTAVPLAAAAALTALWLVSMREPSKLEPPPRVVTQPAEPLLLVQAPADRNVVVFETEDPDVSVIWLY